MKIYPISGYSNLRNKNSKKIINVPQKISDNNLSINNGHSISSVSFSGIHGSFKKGIEALYKLTSSEDTAQKLISELTVNPQYSKSNALILMKKYGLDNRDGWKKFASWCLSPEGYYGAYEKFVNKFFHEAKSIEELLQFQPNWAPWALEKKAWELKNPQYSLISEIQKKEKLNLQYKSFREIPFHIGGLPDIFGTKSNYKELIKKLKAEEILEKTLDINGVKYHIKRLKGGDLNNKFIYLIKIDDEKFILKFDRINVEDADILDGRKLSLFEKKVIRKDKYLAADSIYSNACISKYLELNGSDQVPRLFYYDHKTHSGIFEYIQDINGDAFQQGNTSQIVLDINQINENYKRLNSLGIYLNDTVDTNILETKDGRDMIIDLGHVRFMDVFKPGLKKYNIEFSNSNGPDIGSYYASLFRCLMGLS